MSQRVMCDLFCGRFGWSKGFVAHGWRCIGIDIKRPDEIPDGCEFIQADIAQMYELPPADFYCCSSPCEQFSVHGMKHFHPNPKWPWLGISLFEHTRQMLEETGKPYVMENVRAAKKFVGRNDYQFGPFTLWGNCFASMWPWPAELRKLQKGMTRKALGYREYKCEPGWNTKNVNQDRRGTASKNASIAAQIPERLSFHIAQMAGAM